MTLIPDYFLTWHQFIAPPLHAFAPPTTNKIGAMGAMVPAYFSMTPDASNADRFLCVQISRERSYPCQYIDTTWKAIDCAATLLL